MKRLAQLLCFLALAPAAWSQVSGVLISMGGHSNIPFTVDGQSYSGAANFLWPKSSKHTISVNASNDADSLAAKYVFVSWALTGPLVTQITNNTFIYTADPAFVSVVATFTTNYRFDIVYFLCGSAGSVCLSPGTIETNCGGIIIQNFSQFFPAGTACLLKATPNPGYIFTGWSVTPGNVNTNQTFATSYTLNAPLSVYPGFHLARPVSVTISAFPSNLAVIADSAIIVAPTSLDWGRGTTHTLGAKTLQIDSQGNSWAFSSWSDGTAINHTYTVPDDGSSTIALTATYLPAYKVTFQTLPVGLTLSINGRTNWPDYTFTGSSSTQYTVSAPAQQIDSQGRTNKFVSWSNGRTATQTYTQPAQDDRITATYQTLGRVTINSNPPGVNLSVNGAACQSPCTFDGASGAQLSLKAPGTLSLSDSSRLDFVGWQDSNSTDRTVTFSTAVQTYTANYQMRYRVTTAASPALAGTVLLQPASPDGFYDAGSQVQASASSNPGFQFHNWQGDATGPILNIDNPKLVGAAFNRIPYLSPTAIQNGAGITPVNAVAPGSVVSLFGLNLAPDTASGPSSPLAQTLLNTSIVMGSQILPLYFVSPQQINFQLPFATDLGAHALTLHQQGQPDVTATFIAVRNAPGLFAAAHQDGTPITAAAPAAPGETIQLLGTGFGPFDRNPPDGFILPNGSSFNLVDQIAATTGDTQATVISAVPSSAGVAMINVAVQLPSTLASGTTVPLKVTINGVDSNTIALNIQ